MTSMRKKESSQYFCGNCGKKGHVYRKCLAPITSLGVIVYKMNDNNEREYLMIQRRDTLGFVEFMRGKYNLSNYSYIYELFSIMTENERGRLISKDFDELWSDLWMNKNTRQYHNEYENSRKKYNKLKEGFYGKKDNGDEDFVTLEKIHNTQPVKWQEPEWGFPKGRRNTQENDYNCAVREFIEETGYKANVLQQIKNVIPLEEIFSGSNYNSYRHKYYLNYMSYSDSMTKHSFQKSEISGICWMTYEQCINVIRPYNLEKISVLKNANNCLNSCLMFSIVKNNIDSI